jgi:hypothetical protein
MAVGQFFEFLRSATTYVHPDTDALEQAGGAAPRYLTYHRRIVAVGILGGVIGVIAGIVGAVFVAQEPRAGKEPHMVLLFPVITCVAGLLIAASLACLFAPREFLTGPLGQKWMRLIGTERVFVARVVCFILGVLLPALFIAMVVMLPTRP